MSRTLNDNIAVFDLDGCISDDRWRLSRIPEGASQPLEFDFYHAGCGDDPTLDAGSQALKNHIANGDFIVFATGRPFKVAELTAQWIKKHFDIAPSQDFIILMRNDNDSRSAVEIKSEFVDHMRNYASQTNKQIVAAYDDRPDVIDMYRTRGLPAIQLDVNGIGDADEDDAAEMGVDPDYDGPFTHSILAPSDTADLLAEMSETFRERNAIYGDNAILVGQLMRLFFPNGVKLVTQEDHHFYHLFELLIVKLTRFVRSGLVHRDSLHDLAIYAAMCETTVGAHTIETLGN